MSLTRYVVTTQTAAIGWRVIPSAGIKALASFITDRIPCHSARTAAEMVSAPPFTT